jgi:hypothetical protein
MHRPHHPTAPCAPPSTAPLPLTLRPPATASCCRSSERRARRPRTPPPSPQPAGAAGSRALRPLRRAAHAAPRRRPRRRAPPPTSPSPPPARCAPTPSQNQALFSLLGTTCKREEGGRRARGSASVPRRPMQRPGNRRCKLHTRVGAETPPSCLGSNVHPCRSASRRWRKCALRAAPLRAERGGGGRGSQGAGRRRQPSVSRPSPSARPYLAHAHAPPPLHAPLARWDHQFCPAE